MLHVGLADFIVFVLYYLILKGLLQVINVEARRTGSTMLAAVSGLFA